MSNNIVSDDVFNNLSDSVSDNKAKATSDKHHEVLRLDGLRKSYNIGQPNEIEVLHGIDLYIGRYIINAFEAEKFDLMVTRCATLGIMYYEFKSIDKSYEEVRQKSIIKGIKNIFKDLKKTKDEIW